MAEIKIEIKGLKQLNSKFKKMPTKVKTALRDSIRTAVFVIRPIMRQEAPVRSGKLSRNIYAKVEGMRGEVGPNLEATKYAFFVHQGTKPYTIYPKRKKALYWKGALHPVRKVNHPGIKANPFVDRTASKVGKPVEKIFQNAINKILK